MCIRDRSRNAQKLANTTNGAAYARTACSISVRFRRAPMKVPQKASSVITARTPKSASSIQA